MIETPTAYARREPTTDRMIECKGKRDVVVYRDCECTFFMARFPWYYGSKPTKRNRYTVLNCFRYRLEWMEDKHEDH
jgi:hypothetical protein